MTNTLGYTPQIMSETLSEQQKLFAEARAQGMTGEEAVAHAGYKSQGKAARVQAARMLANDSVVGLINEIRKESRSSSVKTAQDVKEDLSGLMDDAKESKDFSGYTQLANRLAKMDGHDEPERHKLEFDITIGGDADSES